ncbi:putative nadph-adrenodoxin reductase arh1 [Erysiphe necator]|uniref:NADPH:adrenodoxin oxidoreductase, mitochondrial n=1 Tax=Uncinula necator TaxID=52586 RepID=A0A0B1P566_UNCNE|nr:putative nadph-adrenodoxin reductase arh1 [Erysiphe necator]
MRRHPDGNRIARSLDNLLQQGIAMIVAGPCIPKQYAISSIRSLLADVVRHKYQRQKYATTTIRHGPRNDTFRLAVIGSGPAGFYTSYKILSKIETSFVDMYERLPVPFGLVRYGVAPDHPEVKNCQEKFNEIAQSPRFVFVGNVPIGEGLGSIPLRSLLPHYDAILFAYGASLDRKLGIPGEDNLKGVYSAREFVEAIVIGNGNVALDIARILLQSPDKLSLTDITESALETLRKSKIKRVKILGRRGPVQAAFTIKEVRELINLSSVTFHPILDSLLPNENTIEDLPRARRRIMELLKRSSTAFSARKNDIFKSVELGFCLTPKAFNNDLESISRLGSTTFEKTILVPNSQDLRAKSIGTGELIDIKSSVALISVGYKPKALPGFHDIRISFDDNLGIILNDTFGRVKHEDSFEHIPGMYCAGWVKTGPSGIIASTMEDAFLSAEAIAQDWFKGAPFLSTGKACESVLGWAAVKDIAKKYGCRPVSWPEWEKIDKIEKQNGRKKGKEREKFSKIEDILAILN